MSFFVLSSHLSIAESTVSSGRFHRFYRSFNHLQFISKSIFVSIRSFSVKCLHFRHSTVCRLINLRVSSHGILLAVFAQSNPVNLDMQKYSIFFFFFSHFSCAHSFRLAVKNHIKNIVHFWCNGILLVAQSKSTWFGCSVCLCARTNERRVER